MPESVRGEIHFIPVTDADEVFSLAVLGASSAEKENGKQARPKRVTKPKKEPVIPVGGGDAPVSPAVRC